MIRGFLILTPKLLLIPNDEQRLIHHFKSFILKLILSVSTIYILGILWLGVIIGWDKPLIELGVKPFLLAEIFKITLLTILAKKIFRFRKFI